MPDLNDTELAEIERLFVDWQVRLERHRANVKAKGVTDPATSRSGERLSGAYSRLTGALSQNAKSLLSELRRRRAELAP